MVATGGLRLDGEGANQEKLVMRRGWFRFERKDVGLAISKD